MIFKQNRLKKYLRIIFSLGLTFILLKILLEGICFNQLLEAISKVNLGIILPSFLLAVICHFIILPARWKLILKKVGCDLSWQESMIVKAGSDLVINIIPLKIGEFSKALYLKQKKGVSSDKTIFSIFVEYILNAASFLFFIFVGVAIIFFQGKEIFLRLSRQLSFFSLTVKGNFLKNKYFSILKKYLENYSLHFTSFFEKKILFYTFLATFLELAGVYLIALALNIKIPFFMIVAYFPIVIFISSIPVTFAGLGVRESLILFLFFQYSLPENLLALSLLYFFIYFIMPLFFSLGLTFLFLNRITFSKKSC